LGSATVLAYWVAKCLIESFLCKAKEYGGASVLTYEGDKWFGTSLDYMPASFFKKFGFKEADRDESRVLLFLDLDAEKNQGSFTQKQGPVATTMEW